jgi:hypothetical protein
LAANGAGYVKDNYSWDAVIAKYLEILYQFGYTGQK